ncbi:homoserine kinase [Sutcliffiella rhizosphaerae]|uniref:Homoserine kinase n=1 Tax=Sutcliffiella rhizosphaerae TaxID=2880967 RepID=A0ABM8YM87_9BACI|nr:homoserine kinase [Sutcliffiella rhizosphaerae]CAG9621058.1 Homoserine kinase [Sutcliffiella rhizosphaerae]
MKKLQDGFVIKVPGSTANLGPGFDSIGMAVSKYVTIFVSFAEEWTFTNVPPLVIKKEENILWKVCQELEKLWGVTSPPAHVWTMSDIPLARGLGSSAAAIVGAIEMMSVLCNKRLCPDEKLQLAAKFEGHADNVAASLYGGLVISTLKDGNWEYIKFPVDDIDLVAVVPDYEAKTKDSRQLLPKVLNFSDAVKGSSNANVMLGAFLQKKWDLAGKMMESDIFHEPYRQKLFPKLMELKKAAKSAGAFGVTLSGAGPTAICFCERGKSGKVIQKVGSEFPEHKVELLQVSKVGSEVHSNCLSHVASI